MNSIHIIFTILSCLYFFVNSSNSVAQSGRHSTEWESPITTTTTTPAMEPLESKQRTRQTRRSQKMLYNNGKSNDENLKYPKLVNQTDGVIDDLEKDDAHAKEFDHKHRVLLAVESDLKYRDRTKKQEKVKNLPAQNDTTDSKERLKDGLRLLFKKLNTPQTTTDSILQKPQPVNEVISRPQKSRKLLANKPRKPMGRTYLRTLNCEDIPHIETLLHSGLFTDISKSRDTQSQTPMIGQPADMGMKDLYELRRQHLMMKQRRNPLNFFPTYHNYQPLAWPTNPNTYNPYNYNNPYNYFDCNYFMDTVNEYEYPTVQYVWDDYDYDLDRNRIDARTLDMLKSNVRARA